MTLAKKKLCIAALWVSAATLTGCSNSEVSLVKESRMKGWPEYTIGQMLDKRKACTKTDWKSFKDSKDRLIVEYTCIHKLGTRYIQEINERIVNEQKETEATSIKYHKNNLAKLEEKIKSINEELRGREPSDEVYPSIGQIKNMLASVENEYEREKKRGKELERSNKRNAEIEERRKNNFREIQEVFQWTIQDESPIFLKSQIKAVFSDKEFAFTIDMESMFNLAINDSEEINQGYKGVIFQITQKYTGDKE